MRARDLYLAEIESLRNEVGEFPKTKVLENILFVYFIQRGQKNTATLSVWLERAGLGLYSRVWGLAVA